MSDYCAVLCCFALFININSNLIFGKNFLSKNSMFTAIRAKSASLYCDENMYVCYGEDSVIFASSCVV